MGPLRGGARGTTKGGRRGLTEGPITEKMTGMPPKIRGALVDGAIKTNVS